MKSIYLIGSLRNPEIPKIGVKIRDALGIEAFTDWHDASHLADDTWQTNCNLRGYSYEEALNSYGAKNVFNFDKTHLDRCDAAILIMPAGKSGHLELGYMAKDKLAFILFDGIPDRYDVMYNFLTGRFYSQEEMIEGLMKYV